MDVPPNPSWRQSDPRGRMLSDDAFQRYAQYIYSISGIRLTDRKVTALGNRVAKRMAACQIDCVERYLAFIQGSGGKAERRKLIDAITTGETSFFRSEQHFAWFTDEFIPAMVASHRAGERPPRLNLWSAACSVGAEPYTLAMIVAGQSMRIGDWDVNIVGTDISNAVIDEARIGAFRRRMLDNVPPTQLKRCFRPMEDRADWFQLHDRYREMVRFERHNLMDPNPGGLVQSIIPVDCMFLRNVLIYFDDQSKAVVLNNIADALAPGGYLVIGPSEGIFGIKHPLQKINPFLYQKP